ncbi:hypothetical protein KR093_000126 [Drosophila rubida]|uniref:Uncharacterized protein n=1 Tax=Drosophila rubida TaxID=30044 RepID=A0AAD4K5I9_9MUSC|nr:hypothetical protein KR093_000126 [Drosophila rubida]
MQHLLQCRMAYAKTGKPMPKVLRLLSDSESESDCDEIALKKTAAAAAAAIEAGSRRLLNVNACEFVPRGKEDNDPATDCAPSAANRKPEPKLLLPWKGFPKAPRPERPERACKLKLNCNHHDHDHNHNHSSSSRSRLSHAVKTQEPKQPENKAAPSLKRAQPDKEPHALQAEVVGKKPLKEKALLKETSADVKRREHERKVALEALKLVEQRRLRDTPEEKEKQPEQIIKHLTREPVNFSAEERLRVDKLRAIKREQIERVLREMRLELEQKLDRQLERQFDAQLELTLDLKLAHRPEQKQPKTTQRLPTVGRYVGLQRAVKPESAQHVTVPEPEPKPVMLTENKSEPEAEPQLESEPERPRRYIPTVKQWDERCKAKASANKENFIMRKPLARSDDQMPLQRAMAPSSMGNIMPSHVSKEPLPKSDKDHGLFVPRYWPPAPKVASGERRRGNLIHARNISRAFANCGLLPTPIVPGVTLSAVLPEPTDELCELTPPPLSSEQQVKRYEIKQLLELEPQPEQLQVPFIRMNIRQLGFLGD